MTFAPTTAGTMAQILAVLALVSIFGTRYRGTLATKKIRDDTGRIYTVPTEPSRILWWIHWYQFWTTILVLLTIASDVIVVVANQSATGAAAVVYVVVNTSSSGFLLTSIGTLAYDHASQKNDDRHDNP